MRNGESQITRLRIERTSDGSEGLEDAGPRWGGDGPPPVHLYAALAEKERALISDRT